MQYHKRLISILTVCLFLISASQYTKMVDTEFLPYTEQIPDSDIQIKMAPIQGGTFYMGSSSTEKGRNSDEGPKRKVKVNSFWMGVHEITWEQYNQFLDENPQNITNRTITLKDGSKVDVDGVATATPMYVDMSFGMGKEGFPAINMTQYSAAMYAKWLFAKTGNFYRLPTEAEWEYACRSGSTTAFHFGDDTSQLDKYAWYKANSNEKYHKVGTKLPNTYGLYDMHGNVAEWTMDEYKENYFEILQGNPANNPLFKPTKLYPRSVRGGSWMNSPEDLRSANRHASSKKWKQRDPQMPKSIWWLTDAPFIGFRLVRPKETPSKQEIEKYWLSVMDDF
ncbi:Formylglycine-generating enzyme, required for sulfatase activity, contains SUMF1/FGE domain [Maribacter ulvicola]|uniref:Formylglycine-generating enzyme, required for sulfatase activity, contains SUMF1/FGE domain n=2 Tax=Maribacter ulvicola TaxID=228959 RepID=A0A1N6RQB2_9FLAO|nr:Formylglycine-generating enzyme, required for sulfatase activity, contains SUMF1/FGE domain [Maribacter ulvicola]